MFSVKSLKNAATQLSCVIPEDSGIAQLPFIIVDPEPSDEALPPEYTPCGGMSAHKLPATQSLQTDAAIELEKKIDQDLNTNTRFFHGKTEAERRSKYRVFASTPDGNKKHILLDAHDDGHTLRVTVALAPHFHYEIPDETAHFEAQALRMHHLNSSEKAYRILGGTNEQRAAIVKDLRQNNPLMYSIIEGENETAVVFSRHFNPDHNLEAIRANESTKLIHLENVQTKKPGSTPGTTARVNGFFNQKITPMPKAGAASTLAHLQSRSSTKPSPVHAVAAPPSLAHHEALALPTPSLMTPTPPVTASMTFQALSDSECVFPPAYVQSFNSERAQLVSHATPSPLGHACGLFNQHTTSSTSRRLQDIANPPPNPQAFFDRIALGQSDGAWLSVRSLGISGGSAGFELNQLAQRCAEGPGNTHVRQMFSQAST